jgi:hypothetical protein
VRGLQSAGTVMPRCLGGVVLPLPPKLRDLGVRLNLPVSVGVGASLSEGTPFKVGVGVDASLSDGAGDFLPRSVSKPRDE